MFSQAMSRRFARFLFAASTAALIAGGGGCASRAKQSIALYEAGDFAGAAKSADAGLANHPDDDALWGMRIRAALALGDAAQVMTGYATYRDRRGGDDDVTLVRDVAIATLRQALASPSAQMKLVAIRAVASVEIESLADAVGERMGDDDDRVAAAAAVAVLRGFPQAAGVATDMLTSEDPEARRIAVDGIARKAGDFAIADIRRAATDSDAAVRRTAIRWLGEWRDAAASDLLIRNLTHPDAGVRAASVTALGAIGGATAKPADLQRLAAKALGDPALAVRLAGVQVLADAKQTGALAALFGDAHPMVALESTLAANADASSALERAATHEDPAIRAGAANLAVRAVGTARALELGKRLVADVDLRVRLAAARMLAAGGDVASATPVFMAAIGGATIDVGAAADLTRYGNPAGEAALGRTVREGATAELRAGAAAAHVTARRVTPGLLAALADASGLVRVTAAAALAALVDDPA